MDNVDPVSILMTQITGIARTAIAMLPQIALALVILVLTALLAWGVKSVVRRLMGRTSMRRSLKNLFVMLIGLAVWVLGIMIAAIIVFPNLTPASMLAGLGIGTVAIGFAFKDTFENFLAGIIILLRKKMRIGDFIECESIEGTVEDISVRETHIRQTDGQLVIVPNSMLFQNPLYIRTDQDQRRVKVMCGIAYGEDVAQGRRVIEQAVNGCASVVKSAGPVQVFAQTFGASSIDFEVTWWTGSKPLDIRKSRDEVVEAVKSALDEAGIEIPFPYRTLTFAEGVKVSMEQCGERQE
jgi:small-conductance mechanosensitive channel